MHAARDLRLKSGKTKASSRSRTLTRKTSLLRKIEPMTRRSGFANKDHLQPASSLATKASAEMIPEIVNGIDANCSA
jgi:hypothetical protein